MSKRVGLIIPSSNRMVEEEMARAFPPGVTAHVTRLRMTGANHLAFDQLLPRIEEATRALTDARCDVVAFHCKALRSPGAMPIARRRRSSGATTRSRRRIPMRRPISSVARTSPCSASSKSWK
jgi:hypothetical protein